MNRLRAILDRIRARYMRWRWARIVDRAFQRASEQQLSDMGATLSYFTILSLFPFAIVLVGLLGVLGSEPETTDALLHILDSLGPDATDNYKGPIETVVDQDTGGGVALGLGVLFALYTASSYVGAFIRAANRIFGRTEHRPFWQLRPLQIAVTLSTVVMLGLSLTVLVISGPVADAIGDELGVPKLTRAIYSVAKWPALLILLIAVVGLLYGTSPDARRVRGRFVTPGCLWSVGIWLIGSAGFSVYISTFSHYNETYGSLAGAVVLIVWIWLSNLALLVGLLIDAEIQVERERDVAVLQD